MKNRKQKAKSNKDSSVVKLSDRARRVYDAAVTRENRMVAADSVTAQELIDAELAQRSQAGDVYAIAEAENQTSEISE